MAAATILDNFE